MAAKFKDSLATDSSISARNSGLPLPDGEASTLRDLTAIGHGSENSLAQADCRVDQANTRTRRAEARTDRANTRADRADIRTEEANTRTEDAEADTAHAIFAAEVNYRRLFESAPDGILILDAVNGQVLDANPSMTQMLGYSRGELLTRKLWEIGPGRDGAASRISFAQWLLGDGMLREDLPLETKDGVRLEVEFASQAYLADKKQLIQCNVRDVTARKQAEKMATQLAAIVESSEDAILGKDLGGIIQNWNGGAEKIFEYSADEMVGENVSKLIPEDRVAEENEILQRIRNGESVLHFETVRQAKSGRRIDVSITISPIRNSAGTIVGASNVSRDITESRRGEKQIKELNRELEAFSDSVSHDLRAPLRHVLGFVELLRKDAGSALPAKSLAYMATIFESAKRMGDLIDDLLSFSRIGRSEIQKTEVAMNGLVRETLGDFEEETKARGIAWEIHPLPVIRCDRALLQMVLVNLISNAVKFTAKCAAPKIEIGSFVNETDGTVIFVRDNGAGFDSQYVGKLFGVFQRLHSTAEFEGTGIGLANVRRIIHRHGGRTWAEGVVGGGATFYFSIPNQ